MLQRAPRYKLAVNRWLNYLLCAHLVIFSPTIRLSVSERQAWPILCLYVLCRHWWFIQPRMFSGYRSLTVSFSRCGVFIESVVIRATVLFVFSGLLSEETPLELRAQDFNFVIQAHHSSNLPIIYLHWTLLSVDIGPNKNRAFMIPGG